MATPLRRMALFALLLVASACTSVRSGIDSSSDPYGDTTVRVENQAWTDVTVYVERPGERVRLGDVSSQGTRTFRLPSGVTFGSIRFYIDPLGSRHGGRTYDINVTPGDQLRLTIPNL